MPGSHDDEWDTFDFSAWGEESSEGDTSRANGHAQAHDVDEDDDISVDVPHSRPAGKWVSQGGVLNWEEPEARSDDAEPDIRAEAESVWAADEVDLPPGAPDAARVRAVRAWLAKQRQYEVDALGMLLVERREIYGGDEMEARTSSRQHEDNPLDLALAEHQAAVEEYETMLAALEDIVSHNGPARALVEYYLWLGERLAQLAQEPEAPAGFAASMLLAPMEDEESAGPGRPAPTPRAAAEWEGHAEAVTQARRRVERVTAPEPED